MATIIICDRCTAKDALTVENAGVDLCGTCAVSVLERLTGIYGEKVRAEIKQMVNVPGLAEPPVADLAQQVAMPPAMYRRIQLSDQHSCEVFKVQPGAEGFPGMQILYGEERAKIELLEPIADTDQWFAKIVA